MARAKAAVGTAVFLVLAPCVVAGLIPWWLTGWEVDHELWPPIRAGGAVVVGAAVGVLLHAFIRFVVEGVGTPAPVAPTERLVVGGLYRYVRNPMYLAVLAAVAGQAIILGRLDLLAYAALLAVGFVAFVRWYEEPSLHRRFGEEYDAYRRAVPAWLPRRRGPGSARPAR